MEDGRWHGMYAVLAILHPPSSILVVKNMNVGLEHYLVVSALLFALGLLGVITRRNLLVMYMSLELMLNAANLALVSFSRFNNNLNGQILVFFIITVAAAEVSVGLALIVALYRKRQTAHVEDLTTMKL
jgi:NADH-quinone oxidoreductase subunit K